MFLCEMKSTLRDLVEESGLTLAEIGEALGISESAVCNKLAGRRRWALHEVDRLLALLSRKLGRRISYEKAFYTPEPARRKVS
jgi:transcriptional regulator with XRE-family HTH domain